MKNKHKQTCTKVNAFVDEGMVEMASIFDRSFGLRTIESCEGYWDHEFYKEAQHSKKGFRTLGTHHKWLSHEV